MKDYIQQAVQTESKPTAAILDRMEDKARAIHSLMGFTTEVGELTDIFKRHIFYGLPVDYVKIEEECGDILWYMAIMFSHFGFDFEHCMEKNINKLRQRYPAKFTEFDATHRDLDKEREILENDK